MKVLALALTLLTPDAPKALPGGLDVYRFGMPKEEVRGVAACDSSYTEVRVTGGLECRSFRFEGRPLNVSFVFGTEGLEKIQVWLYEGKNRAAAEAAVDGLLSFLKDKYGEVVSPVSTGSEGISREALFREIDRQSADTGRAPKVQVRPRNLPVETVVFASIIWQPQLRYYYVFLYFTAPADPRTPHR